MNFSGGVRAGARTPKHHAPSNEYCDELPVTSLSRRGAWCIGRDYRTNPSLTCTNREARDLSGADHRCCSGSKSHRRPARQRDTAGSCKSRNSQFHHCQNHNARTKGRFVLGPTNAVEAPSKTTAERDSFISSLISMAFPCITAAASIGSPVFGSGN